MEKIIEFLTNNALVIEGVLAILATVLGGWTFKYKNVIFGGLKALADGKVTREEAHKIVDEYYNSKG
jgi:hypothetical protein